MASATMLSTERSTAPVTHPAASASTVRLSLSLVDQKGTAHDSLDASFAKTDRSAAYLDEVFRAISSARSQRKLRKAVLQAENLAPLLWPAIIDAMRVAQPPDRADLFEMLLVAGLDPAHALRRVESLDLSEIERSAWPGVLAAYLSGSRMIAEEMRVRLRNALMLISRDDASSVRVSAIAALAAIADDFPDAKERLQRILAGDPSQLVQSEAQLALDDI